MYRLLITDDEKMILDALYGMLSERFDIEIYRAQSAHRALELLRRMQFDMVITDIAMPRMDGLQLLDIIARTWPSCRVLMLTAHNNFDYVYRAMQYPHMRYLLKIESYDVICQNVAQMMEEIERERSNASLTLRLDQFMHERSFSLRQYLLSRTIIQGVYVPSQEEIDALGVALDVRRPTLLALGEMADYQAETGPGLYRELGQYLEKQVALYGMRVLQVLADRHVIWLIQAEAAIGDAETWQAQAREAIGTLPQLTEEKLSESLAIVVMDAFCEWGALHSFYTMAQVRLTRMRHASGMMILSTRAMREDARLAAPSLGMEEIHMLWEMVRSGEKEEFLSLLRERLAFLRDIPDLRAVPAIPSLAAVTFLLAEALRVYAQGAAPDETWQMFFSGAVTDGGAWLDMTLLLAGQAMDLREHGRHSVSAWIVETANAYIDAHFHEDMTLSDLAAYMSYNPSYLSRCYKEKTGVNLMARLSDVRLTHARRLLRETALRVGEVAASCGFCSTRYFNIAFKKATGMSPAAYRQAK